MAGSRHLHYCFLGYTRIFVTLLAVKKNNKNNVGKDSFSLLKLKLSSSAPFLVVGGGGAVVGMSNVKYPRPARESSCPTWSLVFSPSCLVYIPAAVALGRFPLLFRFSEGVRRRSLNGSKSTRKFSVSNGGSI